jgi:hypothetical protein
MPTMIFNSQPQTLQPAYNDQIFQFTSSNQNEPNYRFVVTVMNEEQTTALKTFKVPLRPQGDYGEINLSSWLQTQVTYDYGEGSFVDGVVTTTKSAFPYYIYLGEEFSVNWIYDDYGYTVDTFTPNGIFEGFVRLNSTNTHFFNVGDQINITQTDGGVLFPEIEGLHNVVYVISSTSIIINLSYWDLTSPGPTMGGSVTFNNNVLYESGTLEKSNVHCVFNGTTNYLDWINWDSTIHSICNNPQTLLTTIPRQNFYMRPTQPFYVDFSYAYDWDLCRERYKEIVFSNSNGDVITSDNIDDVDPSPSTYPRPWVRQVDVGPNTQWAINVQSGSLPLIKPDTEWYEFYLVGAYVSETIRIYIDNRCPINTTQLMFLDRFGSWGSFSFQLRNFEEYTNKKETFNRELDYTNQNGIFDGETTYNSTIERTYRLNTDWMTEEMSEYFEELISSPIVLFRLNDTDVWQPCQVLTNSGEVNKRKNKRLFRKEITIKHSMGEKINI